MKFLRELMEKEWDKAYLRTQLHSTPHSPMTKAVNSARANPNHEYVGSGSAAYIGKSNSPHEMDNVQRISDAEDGTAMYHQKIAETPQIQSNPYFPKIRAQKSENGVAYSVVERLVPFASAVGNYEVLEATWDRMFSVPYAETQMGRISATKRDLEDREISLRNDICETIERMISGRRPPAGIEVVDENLMQAITFLKTLRNVAGSLDLHDENVMWRVTGNMPQLVLNDPFA